MKQHFWYTVVVKDSRGAILLKEGDVDGNNPLACMSKIEQMNTLVWMGQIQNIKLCAIDWDTGMISPTPSIHWTRHGGQHEALRNMDFTPLDNMDWNPHEFGSPVMDKGPASETSHSVRTFMAHEIGKVAAGLSQSFETITPKEL